MVTFDRTIVGMCFVKEVVFVSNNSKEKGQSHGFQLWCKAIT